MTADPTAAGAAEATEAAGAGRAARNFRLGVLNGALYQAGEGFMDFEHGDPVVRVAPHGLQRSGGAGLGARGLGLAPPAPVWVAIESSGTEKR